MGLREIDLEEAGRPCSRPSFVPANLRGAQESELHFWI